MSQSIHLRFNRQQLQFFISRMTSYNPQPLLWLLVAVAALSATGTQAIARPTPASEEAPTLADLSLEELMRVEIVSANRRSQSISDVPAAVYVITREDILRTGVRSLPEALRLAPGVDVAQLSPARWAVGVRGEAGRFANKLQVLIDGRSVYSPMYSGVIWEAERVPMEDIERIEVIRGPAGAVWGNNAVNGVINIITRPPEHTQGNLLSGTLSSDGNNQLLLRHGRATGADSWLRLYAQGDQHDDFKNAQGNPANNQGNTQTAGVRWDQSQRNGSQVSIQGNLTRSNNHGQLPIPDLTTPSYLSSVDSVQTVERANLMGSLDHKLSVNSELHVQTSVQTQHTVQADFLDYSSNTIDVDARHRWHPQDSAHDITWGLGFNWYEDSIESVPLVTFNPSKRTLLNTRLFAQHEYALLPNKVLMTYGARVDHDPYSGAQFAPNARLLWKISDSSSSWMAASRAVRAPSRLEADAGVNITIAGTPWRGVINPGARIIEKVTAFETGWRSQVRQNLSLDVAAFVHRYDPLLGLDQDFLNNPDAQVGSNTLRVSNSTKATTRGIELAADWRITNAWRQQLVFSRLDTHFAKPLIVTPFGGSPRNLLSLRESFDLNAHWMLDLWLRYTSARKDPLVPSLNQPANTALDINVRWAVRPDTTISAGAHNLGKRSRQEINPGLSSQIPRAAFAKVEASF
ncbi:MAG: TonB-dependent receptor [Pseudomonadota bacterium]